MSREAMKLALEALETLVRRAAPWGELDWLNGCKAITAIKEALAQPEHGWTPERIAGMTRLKEAQDKKLAQPEQDTVQRLSALVRAQQITIDKLEALAEQPARPYRQLQDNGSKYFGESWDKADQPAQQEPFGYGRIWGDAKMFVPTLPSVRDGGWLPLYTSSPAQQEPVAYAEQSILDWLADSARGPTAYAKTTLAKRKDGKAQIPLYTSPAQRTWVGLTDEEVRKVNQEVWGYVSADHARMRGYAQAIEAKLRSKNNG